MKETEKSAIKRVRGDIFFFTFRIHFCRYMNRCVVCMLVGPINSKFIIIQGMAVTVANGGGGGAALLLLKQLVLMPVQ